MTDISKETTINKHFKKHMTKLFEQHITDSACIMLVGKIKGEKEFEKLKQNYNFSGISLEFNKESFKVLIGNNSKNYSDSGGEYFYYTDKFCYPIDFINKLLKILDIFCGNYSDTIIMYMPHKEFPLIFSTGDKEYVGLIAPRRGAD